MPNPNQLNVISQKNTSSTSVDNAKVVYRQPAVDDGAAIWQLVKDTGVLDLNSPYAYLLFGEHFNATSVVAELVEADGSKQIIGFISAYLPPSKADTVFVWQVGVAEAGRGRGVATGMLYEIVRRPACQSVTHLDTTVGPSNDASMALFRGFARKLDTQVTENELFGVQHFPPGGDHEPEVLFRIGPFDPHAVKPPE